MNGLEAFDLLPEAVIVMGADGAVVHANSMARRLVGRDPTGEEGARAIPLRTETGDDWWACASPLDGNARLLARIPEVDLELWAGGQAQPIILTAARVAGDNGGLQRLVLCLRRADRRRRLDAARSDLVSTVSHEIRSPLTSVKGFTKTLLAKWERFSDDQKRQMLATIDEDADRVTRLLGELLDVSRIDAGRLSLRREMIDVPAVAARVVERLRLGAGGDRLRLDLLDGVPRLYADPDKVEQIFTNLIENALRHGDGMVTVSAEIRTDDVVFTVSDNGPGIDPAHLQSVFVKFFHRSGERRAGTGLGLYITQGLVDAHGGQIWAESEPGSGATFRFTLPQGGLELAGVEVPASLRDREAGG